MYNVSKLSMNRHAHDEKKNKQKKTTKTKNKQQQKKKKKNATDINKQSKAGSTLPVWEQLAMDQFDP